MNSPLPTLYLVLLVVNCVISIGLAYQRWRGQYAPLTLTFVGIMTLTVVWSAAQFSELISITYEAKYFWIRVQAVGAMGLAVTWYLFVLRQTGRIHSFAWQRILLLYAIPLLSMFLAWTNEFHQWIWQDLTIVSIGSFSTIRYMFGSWFWVQLAYSYVILALTIGVLIDTFRSSVVAYKQQAWVLTAAMSTPWVVNGLFFTEITPFDFTPVATMVSGLILVWGTRRVQLLDLMPIARNMVMEGMQDGVIIVDRYKRVVDVNPAGQKLINIPIDELIGQPVEKVAEEWPEDISWPQATHATTRAYLNIQSNDDLHSLDIEISPLFTWRRAPVGYLVVLHDVTQRHRETQLLNSEKDVLQLLADGAPLETILTTLIHALETQFPAMKGAIYLLSENKRKWQLGAAPTLPPAYVAHLDDVAVEDSTNCRIAVQTKEPVVTVDISADPIWSEMRELPLSYGLRACWSIPIISSDGEVLGSWAIYHQQPHIPMQDESRILARLNPLASITIQRRQTKTTLDTVQQFNERLLASVRDGIIVYDKDLCYQLWNKTMVQMTGLSEAEMLGRRPVEVFPFLREAGVEALLQRALAGETVQMDDTHYTVPQTGKSGWYTARYAPHYNGEGDIIGVVATLTEVTERRNVEMALRQTQKLESLGVLAGGVAHDFNNLLTGMLAQMSLASIKLEANPNVQKHVKQAIMAANQAADLTRQLLAYAGKGQFQIESLNLNQIVEQNTTLLKTSIPKKVSLSLDMSASLPFVEADRGQIQQVVMNLVINGAEAIEPRSGRVQIRTSVSDGELKRGFTQFLPCEGEQQFVCLEVSDTGRGMDRATQECIFDPFFSTKTQGRGLGLSATLGIIRAHGGGLHLKSELDEGTTFRVFFPAGETNHNIGRHETGPLTALAPIKTDKPVVLVVDDEEPVRQAIQDILTAVGLQVMTATNGLEGLILFEQNQSEIGLVILDMQMPIMSGTEILTKLIKVAPDTKVLLSSGYTNVTLPPLDFMRTQIRFLQKPYRLENLVKAVRTFLQES